MKNTYLIFSNGNHVANQIAATGERAIQLASKRVTINTRRAIALQMSLSSPLQWEVAQLETIEWEAC
jgi:hypothetical protein